MLTYLSLTKLTFKYYLYGPIPVSAQDMRAHKTFTFNSDGTVDYNGYISGSFDRWYTAPDVTRCNVYITDYLIDIIFHKLKQKSCDKARHHAMTNYLNRSLCIGGLGFLIK
jgi:hypothetical protein